MGATRGAKHPGGIGVAARLRAAACAVPLWGARAPSHTKTLISQPAPDRTPAHRAWPSRYAASAQNTVVTLSVPIISSCNLAAKLCHVVSHVSAKGLNCLLCQAWGRLG